MNVTRTKSVICIFLMLATFFIYAQVQDHEFTNFDDAILCCLEVYADGFNIKNVQWAFTTFSTGNWFPVTWLSYMLDYQLYGSDAKGYLLTNLFFHIINSLLLFLLLFRMTGKLWQSAFVATLFAFHPLNVESVAWAAERKNVLSTLFLLLTIWAYFRYAEKRTFKTYSLVFLFFTLGLMSKSMLVTLPFALLLLDYWPLRRLELRQEKDSNKISEKHIAMRSQNLWLVLEKIPLFILTVGLSIVTYIAQKSFGNMNYTENLTFSTRLNNAMVSYLEYLRNMVWPEKLGMFYPHPGNTLVIWKGILCGIALIGITIISIRLIRKAPYFAVGWFWYLGTLLPVIGIVQIGGQAMADRYAYVPLIGIFIVVAWGVPELISNWRFKEKVLSFASGIIISALMITTWEQVSYWKNSITLFKHAISIANKKHPNLAIIHNNLGIALFDKQKNEEAIFHYKMSIKLKPSHTLAYYNLGVIFFSEGKVEEAISQYKIAIKLNPNYTSAHYNLGVVLFSGGRFEEAITQYKIAIKLNPNLTSAHYNLGVVLLQKGKIEEAVYYFREALKLQPDFVAARDNLKISLLRLQEL